MCVYLPRWRRRRRERWPPGTELFSKSLISALLMYSLSIFIIKLLTYRLLTSIGCKYFLCRTQTHFFLFFYALHVRRKIIQTQPRRNLYGNDTELKTTLPPRCGVSIVIFFYFLQPWFTTKQNVIYLPVTCHG